MDKQKRIEELEDNIAAYKRMLEMMPNDTVLGRLCVLSLIKKDERKLQMLQV